MIGYIVLQCGNTLLGNTLLGKTLLPHFVSYTVNQYITLGLNMIPVSTIIMGSMASYVVTRRRQLQAHNPNISMYFAILDVSRKRRSTSLVRCA